MSCWEECVSKRVHKHGAGSLLVLDVWIVLSTVVSKLCRSFKSTLKASRMRASVVQTYLEPGRDRVELTH